MSIKIFYYTVERYGSEDKGVRVYNIINNKPLCVTMFDVEWGGDCEARVRAYIEENYKVKEFICEQL